MKKNTRQELVKSALCFLIGIFARFIPHSANFVPIFVLGNVFLTIHKKGVAFLWIFGMIFLSDLVLGFFHGYRLTPTWIGINYLSYFMTFAWLRCRFVMPLMDVGIIAPCLFWGLSNFLLWICFSYYAHNIVGFLTCFYLALPFLATSLVANIIFFVVKELYRLSPSAIKLSHVTYF